MGGEGKIVFIFVVVSLFKKKINLTKKVFVEFWGGEGE